jgi:hypothetical protein
MTKNKTRRKPGNVVQIDLGDGRAAFGRVLENTIAFYDVRFPPAISFEEVIRKPILFNIWVMDRAITNGEWPVVAHFPLENDLLIEALFYKKDPITGALTIYRDSTGEETQATKEQCEGLERAAVWDPHHVVDRLNDHFAGRPNKWVESMRP